MNSEPKAIVLCGGLGTRLRTLYAELPKALVPIRGRPFIEYQMDFLLGQGIRRIHLAAGYRAGQLKTWADGFHVTELHLTVSVEPEPLGTAGGIKFALPFLSSNPGSFFALNGDSLLPHARFEQLHEYVQTNRSAKAVLAAVEMTERGQYGTVEINAHNQIVAFREKADHQRGYVNGGIYLLDPDVLDGIPDGVAVSIEKDIFPKLAEAGQLGAVKVPGPLLDMGTPQGLERTEAFLTSQHPPKKLCR